jgi:hypothetical protein
MVGRMYLECGKPVVVLVRWGKGGGPHNVLIQREDGTRVIRPFRGSRKRETKACTMHPSRPPGA